MPLTVRITPRAKRDITDIKQYLLERDPQAADRVRQHILRAVDLISQHPLIGEVSDVRVKLVSPFPYRIYYRVQTKP